MCVCGGGGGDRLSPRVKFNELWRYPLVGGRFSRVPGKKDPVMP